MTPRNQRYSSNTELPAVNLPGLSMLLLLSTVENMKDSSTVARKSESSSDISSRFWSALHSHSLGLLELFLSEYTCSSNRLPQLLEAFVNHPDYEPLAAVIFIGWWACQNVTLFSPQIRTSDPCWTPTERVYPPRQCMSRSLSEKCATTSRDLNRVIPTKPVRM